MGNIFGTFKDIFSGTFGKQKRYLRRHINRAKIKIIKIDCKEQKRKNKIGF